MKVAAAAAATTASASAASAASAATAGTAPGEDLAIDFGKRFIPEEFTPLYHTRSYAALTPAQRLRYNQLQALYFNELLMFFETAVGGGIFDALLRAGLPARLAATVRRFWDQEREHTAMFRRLNRRCAPRLYARRDLHFIRLAAGWRASLAWAVAHPRRFPMFFWLMLMLEERSLYYSRRYIGGRDSLEPSFVAAHRRHLADEVWHVRWDEELIDTLWRGAHPWLRAANARLFAWMLEEFCGPPKRACFRVLDELGRELPELRGRLPAMRRELAALARDEDYRQTLYSRDIVPIAFARFDAAPDFRGLRICGYRPRHPGQAGAAGHGEGREDDEQDPYRDAAVADGGGAAAGAAVVVAGAGPRGRPAAGSGPGTAAGRYPGTPAGLGPGAAHGQGCGDP